MLAPAESPLPGCHSNTR